MLSDFIYDSAFPNGAYSHSFGLESYISWGYVNDVKSYQKWLESYMLDVFAPTDGATYIIASNFLSNKFSLLKLARVYTASITSFESKTAAIATARATLKNTEFMHDENLKWYSTICQRDEFACTPIVLSMLAKDLISQYAYSTIKTLTQNATRAIPLSYKKSSELIYINQKLAKEVAKKSEQIAKIFLDKGFFSLNFDSKIFSTHHELDLAMYAHEKLDFRLFMS